MTRYTIDHTITQALLMAVLCMCAVLVARGC